MAVRSRRFFGATNLNVLPTLLYTVPAGRTAIIKAIWVSNVGAVPVVVTIGRANVGVGAILKIAVAAGGAQLVPVWFVLGPTDPMYGQADIGATVNVRVSAAGSLLLGEPE